MAHYAFLDENNIVTQVIVGVDENEVRNGISDWEQYYSEKQGQRCVRTSYNGSIRKHYAGIGYTYNETLDAFIPPKPFNSFILNEDTCVWEAPIPYPGDGLMYQWNEEAGDWAAIVFESETPEVES